jgi:hypothetical protein
MSTPLYELVEYKRELEALSDSDELTPEALAEALEAIQGDIQVKVTNVAKFIRNVEVDAVAIREAGKAMLERAARLERRADAVRNYLLWQMQAAGISKVECPWFKIARRLNPPAVQIDDESALPPGFIVTPPPPEPRPDKIRIRDALKAGEPVPGAHLLQTERLEIRE